MPVVWAALAPAEHVFSTADTVEEAAKSLDEERNAAPVVAEHGLLGMVSLAQLRKHLAEGHANWTLAQILPAYDSSDPLTVESFPHLHVDQPLDAALRHMAKARLNALPVVSRTNLRNLRGVVTLNGILRAYGVTGEEEAVPEPAHSVTRRSGAFLPGLIAATLAALLLVGFLGYYYRSERAARADRYFKAGNDLVLHDRNQEAVEQVRNALSVSPVNRDYRLALGLTLVTTGRFEEASVYLEEVLRRDPTNGRANLGLARIAARRERTADAVTCYHRATYGAWSADQAANQMQARFELAAFLERQPDMTVVAEAADGRDCLRLAGEQSPDVVVMDITMPNMNGIEATRRILAANPRTAVVILSMHQDESYVLRSLKAGAKGYLLKDSLRSDILDAIRAVSQGRSFLTRKISRIMQEDYARQMERRGVEDSYDVLTDREREILQLVAEGKANKEVAGLLNISLTTVETHRTHILQKLGLHSVPELILYAVRKSIIS